MSAAEGFIIVSGLVFRLLYKRRHSQWGWRRVITNNLVQWQVLFTFGVLSGYYRQELSSLLDLIVTRWFSMGLELIVNSIIVVVINYQIIAGCYHPGGILIVWVFTHLWVRGQPNLLYRHPNAEPQP